MRYKLDGSETTRFKWSKLNLIEHKSTTLNLSILSNKFSGLILIMSMTEERLLLVGTWMPLIKSIFVLCISHYSLSSSSAGRILSTSNFTGPPWPPTTSNFHRMYIVQWQPRDGYPSQEPRYHLPSIPDSEIAGIQCKFGGALIAIQIYDQTI